MNDGNELERLRARVAELEGQLASQSPPEAVERHRSGWWAAGSAVLLVLACLLAPISVASVWAKTQLSDTNAYVETVAPMAEDPAVQAAVAAEVTRVVLENIDLQGFTTDALQAIAAQPDVPPRVADALPALAAPLTNGVESFTRTQVDRLLATDQFAQLWAQVNRVAHIQVARLLQGDQGGAVTAQDDTITLNLAPVVAQVKSALVAQGFSLAENIPTVDATFVLVQSSSISSAQGAYRLLDTLGTWLPFVVAALFVAGVLLAGDRRRAALRGALGVTAAVIVLGVGLAAGRGWYVGATPAGVLDEAAAGSVFDTLVRFLRTGLRAVAVLGLVVALAAFLAGPSAVARRVRATFEGGTGSLRGRAHDAGWSTGRVGRWTFAHLRAVRVTTLVLGGLVLMFWPRPTGWVVVGVAVAALLVLAVVQLVAEPPVPAGGQRPVGSDQPDLPRQAPAPDHPERVMPADRDDTRVTVTGQSDTGAQE